MDPNRVLAIFSWRQATTTPRQNNYTTSIGSVTCLFSQTASVAFANEYYSGVYQPQMPFFGAYKNDGEKNFSLTQQTAQTTTTMQQQQHQQHTTTYRNQEQHMAMTAAESLRTITDFASGGCNGNCEQQLRSTVTQVGMLPVLQQIIKQDQLVVVVGKHGQRSQCRRGNAGKKKRTLGKIFVSWLYNNVNIVHVIIAHVDNI